MVEIVPYDINWVHIFVRESSIIKEALGNNCLAVYHIGSTSVPGLASKPKVDIMAVVHIGSLSISQLKKIGFAYKGEWNIPFKFGFTKRGKDKINLHVFEKGHAEIELNLLFRDYLCKNSNARNEYALLKQKLAQEFTHQKKNSIVKEYTIGKNNFIQNILKKSGFDKLRFVLCTHTAEWDAAKHFRDSCFSFVHHEIEDPYTWMFNDEEHAHLILYQGTEIIGYTNIHFWINQEAAIRIIVIDENKRDQYFGSKFLALIEKWLKNLGVQTIYAESRQSILRFYLKNGYTKTLFDHTEKHKFDPNSVPVSKLL